MAQGAPRTMGDLATADVHNGVHDNICAAMRLIEHMDIDEQTVGVQEIARLAAELRQALERAYYSSGSCNSS